MGRVRAGSGSTEAPLGYVLVINDSPTVGQRLARWLAQNGYPALHVNSEEEARAMLERGGRFDAVVRASEFIFPPG